MSDDVAHPLDAMRSAYDALQPLEPHQRLSALRWLIETLDVNPATISLSTSSATGRPKYQLDANANAGELAPMTPRQFMALKRPRTDVERITCLAYYLTSVRGEPHFKTQDLTALNTEAAGARFSNAAQASNNALNQNEFLAQAGQGKRQITPRGEAMVDALPDREQVNAALAEFPKKTRRPRRRPARAGS